MTRQRFTAEFKREAVRLLEGSDKPGHSLRWIWVFHATGSTNGAMRCMRKASMLLPVRVDVRCSSLR